MTMKVNQLSKTISVALLATVATSTMANTGQIADNAGTKLTSFTDKVVSTLTGKKVGEAVQVNHPVTLFQYQKASSEYEDAYLNGALNVKDSNTTKTSYDLDVGVNYEKVMSSPNTNIKYEASLNGFVADDGYDNTERTENYSGHAAATYDQYFDPASSPAFWYGKGEVAVQQKVGDDYAGLKNPLVKLSGGLGYGRVVNVTPMAKAMRLVEALVENGNLSSIPSAGTYQQVATIIDKEEEYRKKYDERYEQYWIRDIQSALGQNIGAAGTIRAYEVLTDERISTRKYGWDVRGGLGIVANNFKGNSGNPFMELQGNYYYPISNRTQFSNEARLSAELDDDDNSYVFNNDMGLTYELTDRVDWENKWSLNYQNNENSADVTKNTLSSAFLYELSNSLDYEARINVSHVDVEKQDSTLDKGLFMGVKYRLK